MTVVYQCGIKIEFAKSVKYVLHPCSTRGHLHSDNLRQTEKEREVSPQKKSLVWQGTLTCLLKI